MSGRRRKSAPRSSVLVPWDEAVVIVGGDAKALTHRDGRPRAAATLSRHRNAGVPVQEIGEELLAAWRVARERQDGDSTSSSVREPPMPHEQQVAIQQMTRIFHDHAHPENWELLKVILNQMALESEARRAVVPAGRAR